MSEVQLDPGDFRVRELEFLYRQRKCGIPQYTFLAGGYLAFELDCFLLVGVERKPVLDGPDRAN